MVCLTVSGTSELSFQATRLSDDCHVDHTAVSLIDKHEYHFYYVTSGLLIISCVSELLYVPAGSLACIPANYPYSVQPCGSLSGWNIITSEPGYKSLNNRPVVLISSEFIVSLFNKYSQTVGQGKLRYQHYLGEIFMEELSCLTEIDFALPLPIDSRTAVITEKILQRPEHKWRLGELASEINISEDTLRRRLLRETGLNLTDWVQRARLLKSIKSLAEGEKISDTARQLGYNSTSCFIIYFKRSFGDTPARFRDKLNRASLL